MWIECLPWEEFLARWDPVDELSAGEHVVEMRFEPVTFKVGLGLTLATMLVLALMGGWRLRARLRAAGPK